MISRIIQRIIFLFTFFFATAINFLPAKAQGNYEDVVYLKNGSIIHGMIIEQVPNESIKIKSEKNIFVFRLDEILKITKEEVATAVPAPTPVPVPAPACPSGEAGRVAVPAERESENGYVNILEFTFGRELLHNHSNSAMTGSANSNSQMSIGIQDVNGYRFNSHFSAGIGFGMHIYPGLFYMPVFADFRFRFQKRTTPFISLGIGYTFTQMEVIGFQSTKDYYGGLMVNPSFGFRLPMGSRAGFIMSFGYRYQEAKIYTHNVIFPTNHRYETDYYQRQTLGYMNMKFGFEF